MDMQPTIDALRKQILDLNEKLEQCLSLLKQVTIDSMGGTPDLFCPDDGWDAFDQNVKEILNKGL